MPLREQEAQRSLLALGRQKIIAQAEDQQRQQKDDDEGGVELSAGQAPGIFYVGVVEKLRLAISADAQRIRHQIGLAERERRERQSGQRDAAIGGAEAENARRRIRRRRLGFLGRLQHRRDRVPLLVLLGGDRGELGVFLVDPSEVRRRARRRAQRSAAAGRSAGCVRATAGRAPGGEW